MRVMKFVLDSSAAIKYFLQEKGWEEFEPYLTSPLNTFVINNLVLFEIKLVLARLGRGDDEITAALTHAKSRSETVEISEGAALRAAELKSLYVKREVSLSMADSILAATAEEKKLPLLTADSGLRKVREIKCIP